MDIDINTILVEQWPAALPWIGLLIVVYLVTKFAVLTFESVARALGPVGRWFTARRAITSAESDFLRKQIVALDKTVKALQYRDACYFAYVLKDQEWHQDFELFAASQGWNHIPRHQTFIEFRDKWVKDRGLEKEFELWT
ncbi:Uncharacterised protein [Mycobacteroides abscessus subsp. abscessus]|nr:Uncharacterised protein [Mycobacteroides abscessus subsp. abscessus]